MQEILVPALFDRVVKVHRKRSWRHCDCSLCQLKRRVHNACQFSPLAPPYAGNGWVYRQQRREQLAREGSKMLDAEQAVVLT